MTDTPPQGPRPDGPSSSDDARLSRRQFVTPGTSPRRAKRVEENPPVSEEGGVTRRRLVASGIVAAGAAVVWTSPFPFSDAAIGQLIDTASAASPTGPTGPATAQPEPLAGANHETSNRNSALLSPADGSIAGGVAIFGGDHTLTWPPGAFSASATLSLSSAPLARSTGGFGIGSTALKLEVVGENGAPITTFAQPLRLRIVSPNGTVPSYSADGTTWRNLPLLAGPPPPLGPDGDGYVLNPDGSIDIYTLHASYFGVLKDVQGPTAPSRLTGRFENGSLLLAWGASTDNSGQIARYELHLDGSPIATYPGSATSAANRTFKPRGTSTFVVRAADPSGNLGEPSTPVKVVRVAKPRGVPARVPAWAWKLLAWEQRPAGRRGLRPRTPSPLPSWYGAWKAHRLAPFRIA